jgi:hypothetical protein
MGKKFIEINRLNEERNIDMIVVGHAGKLGALTGHFTCKFSHSVSWNYDKTDWLMKSSDEERKVH